MYYALVHFPDIDTTRIEQIRAKYDPTVALIAPHITLLFPLPDTVGEAAFVQQIEQALATWKPFPIHIQGFTKSPDHWLFLTLQEGRAEVIRLNRAVYSGPLARYRRADIEFIPHIGLGLFAKPGERYDPRRPERLGLDAERYTMALREAAALKLDYRCTLDRLHLVKLSDDRTHIERGREFLLGAPPSWYHGSPLELTSLREGSTITQDRHLAEVFSHKPAMVCIDDDGSIKHTGRLPGFLYRIAEPVAPEDAYAHPRTTMPPGKEWLTRRELKLELLGPTTVHEEDLLTEEDIAELRRRQG
jgi:2'-5' RNA ligase